MIRNYLIATILLALFTLNTAFAQTGVRDSIYESLTPFLGDPIRGRATIVSRQTGLCILCHSGPFSEERFQGNLAPDLGISATRLSAPQLRARIIDASRFNRNTIMPSYYHTEGLNRVAPKFAGQTILSGQDIEDVIAFLVTLNLSNTPSR